MTTYTHATKPTSVNDIEATWHLIDMKGKVLGRQIPLISSLLQGKGKTNYVPNLDSGDNVVVINASSLVITGAKADNKEYRYYSGYPGGEKIIPFKRMLKNKPAEIIRHAIIGMLPKNKLRDRRMARLFIFADENHPYKEKFV